MLTAILPVYAASRIASLIPPVPALPNWLNDLISFGFWAFLCIACIMAWGRLLHLLRILDDEQLSRFPFGFGAGRN